MSFSNFARTRKLPEDTICLCGDTECARLTAGFADFRDARKRFVRLPPHANVDSPFYQERNRRRAAYLRHLCPNHDPSQDAPSDFIALHHFHPTIIKENTREIPKSLSLGQAVQLKMILSEKDRVVDENGGLPRLVFVPNYEKHKVKRDLETLAREARGDDWSDKESEASTIEIPEHISFDEESDISSIDCMFDEKTDKVTFMPLVPAEKTRQVILSTFIGGERVEGDVETNASSKTVASLEETMDTTTEAEKNDATKVEDCVEAIIETRVEANDTNNCVKESLNKSKFYSFQDLKSGVEGVESTQREQYLSPDEFEEVFDMSKEEFNRLRKWRQQEMKRKVGFF